MDFCFIIKCFVHILFYFVFIYLTAVIVPAVCPACRLLCDVRRSQHIPRRVGAAGGQAQAALHLGAQDTPGCRWVGGHGGSEQRLNSNTII